jgi:Ca2+-binding EF-hand superfamily protein
MVFRCFDRDGDGKISRQEMLRCFSTYLITIFNKTSEQKSRSRDEMISNLSKLALESTGKVFDAVNIYNSACSHLVHFLNIFYSYEIN